jgi:hypothetical protein
MALHGNLRDFSVIEILQLLGSQNKTGCLMLEWNTERAQVYVHDGRIIATRQPGMKPDDPLLAFLVKVHRLSDEQRRGLVSIHRESDRDLEDLLLNGRYLEAEELKNYVERQILNDLMRVVRWESGNYRFEPKCVWPAAPLVRLSMEGALIEAARRVDEQKRFASRFRNPHDLLGVRDLPDPDEPLSEEEKELFGIIDGHHTTAEVVEDAPLLEYEAYESLDRMFEAQWIEVVGQRNVGEAPPPPRVAVAAVPAARMTRELLVGALVLTAAIGLRISALAMDARRFPETQATAAFAASRADEIRAAVELYRRDTGAYPRNLNALIADDWLEADRLRIRGYRLRYEVVRDGGSYRLDLDPER